MYRCSTPQYEMELYGWTMETYVTEAEIIVKCVCGHLIWLEAGVLEYNTHVDNIGFVCGNCLQQNTIHIKVDNGFYFKG